MRYSPIDKPEFCCVAMKALKFGDEKKQPMRLNNYTSLGSPDSQQPAHGCSIRLAKTFTARRYLIFRPKGFIFATKPRLPILACLVRLLLTIGPSGPTNGT